MRQVPDGAGTAGCCIGCSAPVKSTVQPAAANDREKMAESRKTNEKVTENVPPTSIPFELPPLLALSQPATRHGISSFAAAASPTKQQALAFVRWQSWSQRSSSWSPFVREKNLLEEKRTGRRAPQNDETSLRTGNMITLAISYVFVVQSRLIECTCKTAILNTIPPANNRLPLLVGRINGPRRC